jgi:alkaline phosphatase D
MLTRILNFSAWMTVAIASWNGNINYGSPSLRHDPLGIDKGKVKKRMLQKRDGSYHHDTDVKFTHGVASVRGMSACS